MACTLRAHGVDFDVDAFLHESTLTSCAVFRRGEARLPASQPEGPRLQRSGLNVGVSEAEFGDMEQQTRDALAFLRQNEEEIARLAGYTGVEGIELDFAVYRGDGFVESFRLPAELASRAGRLGIVLCVSTYNAPVPEPTPN